MVSHPITKEEFQNLIRSGKSVVSFCAKWCGPCVKIAPYFEELSKSYINMKFVKVDIDELQSVASELGIRAMPTFYVYENGKVIDQLVGASKPCLYELINKNSKSSSPSSSPNSNYSTSYYNYPTSSNSSTSNQSYNSSQQTIKHPRTRDEYNQLVRSGKVIVDFTATWCGPCRSIAPYFEELPKKYTNITFIKVDVDELSDVTSEVGVRSMPTFCAYADGKIIDTFSGASKEKLDAMIAKLSA